MHFLQVDSLAKRPKSDLIILPFWQGAKSAEPACPQKEFASLCTLPIKTHDFQGKEAEIVILYTGEGKESRLLLLGLGKEKECTKEVLRRAYAAAAKMARQKKAVEVALCFPEQPSDYKVAAVEGICLANYVFDKLKPETVKLTPSVLIKKLHLVGISKKELEGIHRTDTITSAVNFARDLVNGNADDVTPQMLSLTAQNLAKEYARVKTTVFGKKEIEKKGLGLLLAVNRGSHRDPAFILIEYRGNPASKELTALVGKGITYDTGGLNLKPTGSMETMKDDMSGAAAVLGTIKAAAELKLKVNLLGVIASTENAIGPMSYKPGDVYKSYAGKMIEISNTDAEGRLVLADAVAYVQDHYKPKAIIDLATLTGGVVIALGEETTGLFTNNDTLAAALIKAGESTHERVWRMPLFPEYKEGLKSQIADLRNSADRKASSITAALFIQEFIKEVPWAHLDIAGTAYITTPKHYNTTSATGVGVRLLIEYLSHHADV